jgi:hypothetical protein
MSQPTPKQEVPALQSGEVVMEIKALRRLGWTVTRIAEEYDLARGTVYAALASEGPRQYGPRVRPMALTPAQLVHVERRLVVCPDLRGTDLHAELRHDYGYEGSYPAFQRCGCSGRRL